MLVFGQEVGEKDCEFNITSQTKNFIVGFFGFFNHHMHERFIRFLESCEIDEVAGQSDISNSLFTLNGKYGIQVYNTFSSKTFDVTVFLPHSFNSEKEALDWFNQKLKDSPDLYESDLSNIEVIDADKLLKHLDFLKSYKEKTEFISAQIKEEMKYLEKRLIEKYGKDSDYKNIINHQFKSVKV